MNLENINDGVEYTRGGVGINSSKKVNKGDFIKLKSAPAENGLSMTSTKKFKKSKKVENVDYNSTINFLKQDILRVKYLIIHKIDEIFNRLNKIWRREKKVIMK